MFKPDPVYFKREKPEIYVKKWIDYTHKYGFGCILSNDSVCVNFNDGSRMILDEDLHHISYYEAREELTKTPANYGCFTLGTYPPELAKKVQLMEHFWSFLNGNESFKNLAKYALEKLDQEAMIGKKKQHKHD